MSPSPTETETHDVALDRAERWVVHAVLTARGDEAVDDRESPPEWVLAALETIEAGGETFTREQGRNLHDALRAYAVDDDTPGRDVEHAVAVRDRLEATLD